MTMYLIIIAKIPNVVQCLYFTGIDLYAVRFDEIQNNMQALNEIVEPEKQISVIDSNDVDVKVSALVNIIAECSDS